MAVTGAHTAAPAALPFNKMFLMLPVMLAARKLDGDDAATVQFLRIAYGTMQVISVAVVLYTYLTAASQRHRSGDRLVYVPAPPQVRSSFVPP